MIVLVFIQFPHSRSKKKISLSWERKIENNRDFKAWKSLDYYQEREVEGGERILLKRTPKRKTNKNDLIMLPRCRRKTNSNKWHCNVGMILKF